MAAPMAMRSPPTEAAIVVALPVKGAGELEEPPAPPEAEGSEAEGAVPEGAGLEAVGYGAIMEVGYKVALAVETTVVAGAAVVGGAAALLVSAAAVV